MSETAVWMARYTDPQGNSFSLTLTADSPLVAQMAGILGNPQMMAMMGVLGAVDFTRLAAYDS